MRRFIFNPLVRAGDVVMLSCYTRLFSVTQCCTGPKRAAVGRQRKVSTPTRLHSSSRGSSKGRNTSSRRVETQNSDNTTNNNNNNNNNTGKGEGRDEAADIAEEERRLVEGDTRLAMRLLMQHHFLYQNNVRRPEEQRLEEEREKLREKHRARMERIEQKTRNSMELGPDVSVDGILPIYKHSKGVAAIGAGAAAASSTSSWMRRNSVEAEADGLNKNYISTDGDDYDELNSASVSSLLMKPNITAYDAENDHRIRSAEVLDEEQRRRREELKSGDATNKLWSPEELETGGGLTPQRVVQSQLLDDEDQDFAVEAYMDDFDE